MAVFEGSKVDVIPQSNVEDVSLPPAPGNSNREEKERKEGKGNTIAIAVGIIEILKTHDPDSIPIPGEDPRFIGCRAPTAQITLDQEKVDVAVYLDTTSNFLWIVAVDENGEPSRISLPDRTVYSWNISKELLEDFREKCKDKKISGYYSGGLSTFYTGDPEQIPRDYLEKHNIKVEKNVVQETADLFRAQISLTPEGKLDEKKYSSVEIRGDYKSDNTPEFYQKLIAEVSSNLKRDVKNPELYRGEDYILNSLLPEIVRTRLYPNQYSQAGFLGAEDDFEKVLAADSALLKSLGVSHLQIADALNEVLTRAEKAFEDETQNIMSSGLGRKVVVEINGRELEVAVAYTRGFQLNPFQEIIDWSNWTRFKNGEITAEQVQNLEVPYKQYGPIYLGQKYPARGTGDFTITDRETGKMIAGGDMAPVLIGMGFFEGPGTPYRMDPKSFAEVLGLIPVGRQEQDSHSNDELSRYQVVRFPRLRKVFQVLFGRGARDND